MEIVFWISVLLIFYAFFGYGILLYVLVRIKRLFAKKVKPKIDIIDQDLPSCALVIAAYNEELVIAQKITNSLSLTYAPGKLQLYVVTDGSTDKTAEIVKGYEPFVKHLHLDERKGKIAAVHRTIAGIKEEIIIFTDANTMVNQEGLVQLVRHYADPSVGAVAGEKRVGYGELADASSAGEGIYWKYESLLKKWDSELYSVVGAAGELFSIRRSLYAPVKPDTVLDDFMISMLIAKQGFRIVYEPNAYAIEEGSANVSEELKRKIRIAAGGIQSIVRLKSLLNPIKNPVLSFQYISHRVLRWTVTPFLLVLVFLLNHYLAIKQNEGVYWIILGLQYLFYSLAYIGFLLQQKEIKFKIAFIPYYFCMMNYAVHEGIKRYLFHTQSAVWEKAKRK